MSASPASAGQLGGEPRPPVPFEDLLRAHRRELLVHCYRMLGSWTDAEDVLQDVSLQAWRGLGRFEGRAWARSWLYRIATNACLTALRDSSAADENRLAPESLLMNVSGMPRGGGACGRGSGIGLRGPRPRRQEASREPPEGRQDDGNDRDDVAEGRVEGGMARSAQGAPSQGRYGDD